MSHVKQRPTAHQCIRMCMLHQHHRTEWETIVGSTFMTLGSRRQLIYSIIYRRIRKARSTPCNKDLAYCFSVYLLRNACANVLQEKGIPSETHGCSDLRPTLGACELPQQREGHMCTCSGKLADYKLMDFKALRKSCTTRVALHHRKVVKLQ